MSCGIGHRHSSDLALLWLRCRPAATALNQPLALELPYATDAALKKTKKKKKKSLHVNTLSKKLLEYLTHNEQKSVTVFTKMHIFSLFH